MTNYSKQQVIKKNNKRESGEGEQTENKKIELSTKKIISRCSKLIAYMNLIKRLCFYKKVMLSKALFFIKKTAFP